MEGYIDEFKKVLSLEKIELKPNETLIMRYNLDKIGLNEINEIYNYIADIFSYNKIIAIPDNTTLTKFDKEELIDIYNYISNLIEEL